MRGVKTLLDPKGILNPYKVLPPADPHNENAFKAALASGTLSLLLCARSQLVCALAELCSRRTTFVLCCDLAGAAQSAAAAAAVAAVRNAT